jgi:hypothetical protein
MTIQRWAAEQNGATAMLPLTPPPQLTGPWVTGHRGHNEAHDWRRLHLFADCPFLLRAKWSRPPDSGEQPPTCYFCRKRQLRLTASSA